jgi:hypothetical protein
MKDVMACDIGYLIKDHIPAIMQVLTIELREYNMQLITTKCLNTAVMIMYLMLGADALHSTRYCDVQNIRQRVKGNIEQPSSNVARDLRDVVMGGKKRALIYVMITDGRMQVQQQPQSRANANAGSKNVQKAGSAYFPGHVFVIERLPRGTFNLYQSYINHYDLWGHIERQASLSVGRTRMQEIVDGLARLMSIRSWDSDATEFWMKLTNTPESHARQFEGHVIHGNLFMCYREVITNNCVKKLNDLVARTLDSLSNIAPELMDQTYGDASMFDSDTKPLTARQVLQSFEALKQKLS